MKKLWREAKETRDRARAAGLQFVRVEIELVLSLLDSARNSLTDEHRDRCLADVKHALRTIKRVVPRLHLDAEEKEDMRKRLARAVEKSRAFGFIGDDVTL